VNPQINGFSFSLWFLADLPALGYATYIISPLKDKKIPAANMGQLVTLKERQTIENEFVLLNYSDVTGLLMTFTNKRTGTVTNLIQNFWEYDSFNFPQSSGAYIFRPTGPANTLTHASTTFIIGSYLSVVHQEFQGDMLDVIAQEVRLFNGLDANEGAFVDLEIFVGPLRYDQEVITRFQSNIQSGSTLFL